MLQPLQIFLTAHGLKLAFLGSLAFFLVQVLRSPYPLTRKALPPAGRRIAFVLSAAILPLFIGTLAYQATWQLTGFARPEFVRFMRAYNRRDVNAARELQRGRIFDRNGLELAYDRAVPQRARFYPYGSDFCHLIGYANPVYGLQGIERTEDAWLSGRRFGSDQDLNRFARNILDRDRITGSDLQLTADARLQTLATRLLDGRRGAVVALRPSDGAVLALVSAPGFNPNQLSPALFSNAARHEAPLLNRALHGLYPPGSTFKMAIATLAIDSGFDRKLDCPAEGFAAAPGARPIRDHAYYVNQRQGRTWPGYGLIGLREAFAKSSNVFFARLGTELGPEALNDSAATWFFHRAIPLQGIGRDGPATRPGTIPLLRSDERLRVAHLSIGQGELLVTPLQMAVLTAAIANGGIAMQPRIVISVAPAILGTITSPATAGQVRSLMREAVVNGTGRQALLPDLEIAGKTGTAQVAGGADHAWFVCFAPAANPTLAVVVLVENGGYGSATALPIATALLQEAQKIGLLATSASPPPSQAVRP